MSAAILDGDIEELAATAAQLAALLVEDSRPAEAIDELQEAIDVVLTSGYDPVRTGGVLWPLLATLARHLDDSGDRQAARRAAADSQRQAMRCGSVFGREVTRVLLVHLAMRKTG